MISNISTGELNKNDDGRYMNKINSYIIYNERIAESKRNAVSCKNSMKKFNNYIVHLHDGCHPDSLNQYEERYQIGNQRSVAECSYNTTGHPQHSSKKSCFYSHYELWRICIKLDQPIVILENDVFCNIDFPLDVLCQMSEITHLAFSSIITGRAGYGGGGEILTLNEYKGLSVGGHPIKNFPAIKKHNQNYAMAGNMAYLIKPAAAVRLIKECQENGWLQNDRLMLYPKYELGITKPDVFTYDINKELHTTLPRGK